MKLGYKSGMAVLHELVKKCHMVLVYFDDKSLDDTKKIQSSVLVTRYFPQNNFPEARYN